MKSQLALFSHRMMPMSIFFSLIAEAKRKAAAEAAAAKREEQKRLAEEKRAAAAEAAAKKKQEAETKRAAAQAQKSVQKAAPGATVSLFGFGGGGGKPAPAPAQVQAAKAAAASAPRGVPTISSWKQNRDGSISGFISGSPSFDDGESVTTSPIKGEAAAGTVVQTGSGSKYFLAPQSQKKSTTFSLFGGDGGGAKVAPAPAPARAKSAPAGPSPAALAAQARKEQQAKLAEERKAAAEARKAEGKSRCDLQMVKFHTLTNAMHHLTKPLFAPRINNVRAILQPRRSARLPPRLLPRRGKNRNGWRRRSVLLLPRRRQPPRPRNR